MKRAVGWALLGAAAFGFELAIYYLAGTGTCASGGPYEIAAECPPGTGAWVALLIFAALATIPATLLIGSDRLLPAMAFVPGFKECAILCLLTAGVILLSGFAPWSDAGSGEREGAVIAAGALVLFGPGSWLVGRGLARLARPPR
jgi:hypothetical protein